MSAVTHTPGPWQLHKSDDTLVIGSDGREVAEACGDYTEEAEWPRMEANSRLIAAAPELLASLREFVEAAERSGITLAHDALLNRYERAKAAIAKVEGRS